MSVLVSYYHTGLMSGRMNLIHNYEESSHVNHSFRMGIKVNMYLPDNKEEVLGDNLASRMNSKLKCIKSNDCHIV